VPVTGGLAAGGLRYAAETGAEAIQVFVSNPRGWALSAGDARQDAALRDHVARTALPVFVHATYLINLGSPDPVTRRRAALSGRAGPCDGANGSFVGVVSVCRAGSSRFSLASGHASRETTTAENPPPARPPRLVMAIVVGPLHEL